MIDKILSSFMYVLRWFVWAFHYLVILPAGMLLLIFILLFWLDNSTPGKAMADEIASATRNVSAGEFRISGCEGLKDIPQRQACDRAAITDAAGYAAHFDRSWRSPLISLWVVMAFTSSWLSFTTRTYPVYPVRRKTPSFRAGI